MTHFAGAKRLGATDEEIAEAVHMPASVGAGVALAMADRSHTASDAHHYWWRPSQEDRREMVVFDAYGTLWHIQAIEEAVATVAGTARSGTVLELWRKKQLEYAFLRTLMETATSHSPRLPVTPCCTP
ncbi:MAG: hypothetical protein M1272_00150 [Firmicutes bacterium]|nr:hypothetical protein [Bacillota bacterium]